MDLSQLQIIGDIHQDPATLEKFSRDMSAYKIVPDLVVEPKNEESRVFRKPLRLQNKKVKHSPMLHVACRDFCIGPVTPEHVRPPRASDGASRVLVENKA